MKNFSNVLSYYAGKCKLNYVRAFDRGLVTQSGGPTMEELKRMTKQHAARGFTEYLLDKLPCEVSEDYSRWCTNYKLSGWVFTDDEIWRIMNNIYEAGYAACEADVNSKK